MHPHTPTLTAAVRSAPENRRLDRLHDAYAGQSGVVVTCGPSLATFDPARLKKALTGRVVFTVKQAIDVVGEQADFLCFNTYNVSRYRVPNRSTMRILSSEPTGRLPQMNRYDLRLPHAAHSGHLADSLVARQDFDDYLLRRTPIRPWGPGILHELVFYLAVHFGLSELTTVGWDIANSRGHNVHFYDPPGNFFDRGRADAYKMVAVRKGLPPHVRVALRWLRTASIHSRGGVYNRTTMIRGESEVVAASVPATASWLEGHGVRLRIVGDSEFIDPTLPRLTRDQFYAGA